MAVMSAETYAATLSRDRAVRILKYLRRGAKDFDGFLHIMRDCLRQECLELKDIGVDEAELAELKLKSYKIRALDCLNTLRCGSPNPETELILLRGNLKEAGLALSDIGVTEEELVVLSERIDLY